MEENTFEEESNTQTEEPQLVGFCADLSITIRDGKISYNVTKSTHKISHAGMISIMETIRDGVLMEGLSLVQKDKLREIVNLNALDALVPKPYSEPL